MPIDTSGFHNSSAAQTSLDNLIYKNAFGLEFTIDLEPVIEQVVDSISDDEVSNKEFLELERLDKPTRDSYLYDCDSVSYINNFYVVEDDILEIQLTVLDVQIGSSYVVTDNFEVVDRYNYNNTTSSDQSKLTIQDYVNNIQEYQFNYYDSFLNLNLYLKNFQNIPDNVIFKVGVFLRSGREIHGQTSQINFDAI